MSQILQCLTTLFRGYCVGTSIVRECFLNTLCLMRPAVWTEVPEQSESNHEDWVEPATPEFNQPEHWT